MGTCKEGPAARTGRELVCNFHPRKDLACHSTLHHLEGIVALLCTGRAQLVEQVFLVEGQSCQEAPSPPKS